ncbi:fatty acid desaturase [Pelagibius litoralis]|uniref:Fatty acid desaturase n=1 Tax=Pelagibius litoralis TaxID=374515 RepID=A0A967EX09_9PROT|nr:fatty acid desaturase [Pelagibius litoralis]NIA67100.1 fatty acid desaturase [Pelagibius litoralis]
MEEEVYRNATVDKQALKALSQRSDAKGLVQLGGHLGLLLVSGSTVLLSEQALVYAAALFAHGVALVFLFAPLHECIHRTAFRSRWLNNLVAQVCGLILALPAGYFRAFHFQHHRFTQDPGQDPELAVSPPESLAGYVLHVSGLPYWWERSRTILHHTLGRVGENFIVGRQRSEILREARSHLAIYLILLVGSLWAGSSILLDLWVLPVLLGQPLLRLFLMAEHSGCPQTADMLINSRTTETNGALQWLCWNMNRHGAHHAYPALPFRALPAADVLLAKHQTMTRSRGYGAVQRDILRRIQGSAK